MIPVAPPPEEEQQNLLAISHRFPEKRTLTVFGEGGQLVRLPYIIANPTGACALPAGKRPTVAWGNLVRAQLKLGEDGPRIVQSVVEDCLLWPGRDLLAQWAEYWPGLYASLMVPVRRKVAGDAGSLVTPDPDDEDDQPPAPIAEALAAHPRAVWRWLVPRKAERFAIVIDAPDGPTWRLFQEAMNKPDVDAWALVLDVVRACNRAITSPKGEAASLDATLNRWPGLGVGLFTVASVLGGAAAADEEGGW